MTAKKHFFTKKRVLITSGIIVAAGVAFSGYYFFIADRGEPPGQPTSPINYDPATPEEEAEGEAITEPTQQSDSQGKRQVTPVMANASQSGQEIFVSGYVPGIAQDGGKCTYTITKGGATVTKTTDGFVNVSNTNCTPATIDRSEFNSSGDWQVVVSYNSGSATGTSQPMTLKVQ